MRIRVAQSILTNLTATYNGTLDGTGMLNAVASGNATIATPLTFMPDFVESFVSQMPGLPVLPHHSLTRHPFWEMQAGYLTGEYGEGVMSVVYCSLALFFSGVLCSAAGIGGGGIYVVVLMLVGALSPHDAVPMSKAVVFFGSISTLLLNLARSNSEKGATEKVIDWHGVRVVAPATLGGTFLGVLFNWHTEGYFVVLCLCFILIFMTIMVTRTAMQQYEAEERALMTGETPETRLQGGPAGGGAPAIADPAMLAKQKAEGELSNKELALLVGLEALIVACGALRFHMEACKQDLLKDVEVRQDLCTHPISTMFFGGHLDQWLVGPQASPAIMHLVSFLPLAVCLGLSLYFGHNTVRDAGWSRTEIGQYQVMAIFTGCFAGLVGVGGGLVFSPFFLVMGMDPAAAIATSSTCVLFTSSSTTLQYMLTDRIIMSLALVYGGFCLVASYLGTSLVHVVQDKFNGRKSYVTMIVVAAIALSAVLSMIKVYTIMSKPVATN